MRTNVLPLGSDAREGGLFLTGSRINHSCRNNAQNTWNEKIGCITIHAVQGIEEGQEVLITYLGQAAPYAERQQTLRDKFFFDCKCELCSLPPIQREESDGRQQMIQDIDDSIGSSAIIRDIETGLNAVRVLLELLDQEGITDASIPRAYYDAFQIAIAHGDKARAKIFAERAYAARVIAEGDDSPDTMKLKRLAERPTEHLSYGIFGNHSRSVASTTRKDGEGLENWLWMQSSHESILQTVQLCHRCSALYRLYCGPRQSNRWTTSTFGTRSH